MPASLVLHKGQLVPTVEGCCTQLQAVACSWRLCVCNTLFTYAVIGILRSRQVLWLAAAQCKSWGLLDYTSKQAAQGYELVA